MAPWGGLLPGEYWDTDLKIRSELQESGRHPRVILRSLNDIKTLTYRFTKADEYSGECKIHLVPRDHFSLELWLSKMDTRIPYTGQTLASLCAAYVSEKLRAARPEIPAAVKKRCSLGKGGPVPAGRPW